MTLILLKEPIFNCNFEPQLLMSSFVTLKNLEDRSKMEMGLKLLNIGTTIKEKLERVPSTLNKRKRTF